MADAQRTWGGRFEGGMGRLTQEYTAGADRTLWRHDITGSIAHARMLGRQGIIPADAADAIVQGLGQVLEDFEAGRVEWRPELEDIHTHVEVELRAKIGDPAGMLHTARSRNDQVALLNRMLVREACDELRDALAALIRVLSDIGEEHAAHPMPGYTHVQRAQPVTIGHHMLAYAEMFLRDFERLGDCRRRANVMPLGAGALAGSPYPLDRQFVARELSFSGVTRNSLDTVSDRDYIVEFLSAVSLVQMHLSRFSEEIILWASAEFGFVDLPDEFATGSSMMPQKKNADVAELARGRTGRVYGELINMLTNLKGLPLAYNRDLQEDKLAVINAMGIVLPSVEIFAAMLPVLRFRLDRLRQAAGAGYSLATDVADYLVKRGMPFREAHGVVGGLVRECEARGCELNELPFDVYREASELFEQDVLDITIDTALAERDIPGGTAPARVRQAAQEVRELLSLSTPPAASASAQDGA